MRRFLLITSLCLQTALFSIAQDAEELRVLTFNIFHGEIYSPGQAETAINNLGIVSEIINAVKPDLVALQEVDCKTRRSSGIDLLTELALKTRMYSLYGRAMKFDGGEYGLGILSKYSFSSSSLKTLFSPEGSEPRIALESFVVLETGDTIRFVCTHLDHTSSDTRNSQAEDLINYFGKDCYPTILAGDLNARPESNTISILEASFIDSWQNNESDLPSVNSERRIDYILYRQNSGWTLKESRVIDGKNASDHNPVLSVFTIKNR